MTLSEDLEESVFADVDGRLPFAGTALILGNETHDLVQIEDRAVEFVALEVISPHPDFAEVTRMVLVEVDSVMMLTSGVSATSRMFPVFSNASMTVTNVAS